MAQFDVHMLPDGGLVVDVQSDHVRTFGTRLVIPLIEPDADAAETDRLNPVVPFQGGNLLLATQLAGAVRSHLLRSPVGSVTDHDYTIKLAIDFLLSGF